jgi:hypothetical protein
MDVILRQNRGYIYYEYALMTPDTYSRHQSKTYNRCNGIAPFEERVRLFIDEDNSRRHLMTVCTPRLLFHSPIDRASLLAPTR